MSNDFVEKFCAAAEAGQLEIIKDIVNAGVIDINAYNIKGWTALKRAVNKNHTSIARFLLESGADPNLPDLKDGRWVPLHNAAYHNNKELIELLLQCGADANVLNDEQKLPVEKAASQVAEWMRDRVIFYAGFKKDPWQKLGDEMVARTQYFAEIRQRRTEIFDFKNRHWTMTIQDTVSNQQSTVIKMFDEMHDKAMLEEAHAKLRELGGKAEQSVIYAQHRVKKEFPKAG